MEKLLTVIFCIIYIMPQIFAQANIDSLERIVALGKQDVAEAEALNKLATIYSRKDNNKTRIYLDQAYHVSKKIDNANTLSIVYYQLITLFQNTGKLDSARYYLNQLDLLSKNAPEKHKNQITFDYNQAAGLYYRKIGNYRDAIRHYEQALVLTQKLNKTDVALAGLYLNLANAYTKTLNYKVGLQHYFKALTLFEKFNNDLGKSFCYQGICNLYLEMGKPNESLKYAKKSLQLKLILNDRPSIGTAYNSLGNIYLDLGNFKEAIIYFNNSFRIAKEMNLKIDEQRALFNLGKAYAKLNNKEKAKAYFTNCALMVKETGDSSMLVLLNSELENLKANVNTAPEHDLNVATNLDALQEKGDLISQLSLYKNAAIYYETNKEYEKALQFSKKYYELNDSLKSSDVQLQIQHLEAQYNSDKKENEISILKKDQLIDRANLERQKIVKYSVILISALLAIMGFFIFKRSKQNQQLKELKLRNQIAADLHDEVGSSLSSIHILSQLAERSVTHAASSDILIKMTRNVQETMDRMSDIVWVVKPKINDSQSLPARMENFMFEICQGKEIECNFLSADMAEINLGMDLKKNLYLIFKEAVNNAVKYADTKQLDVTISIKQNLFKMVIKDYGKGFAIENNKKGNGIGNMKNRAKEMNADFKMISQPGAGTQIEVQVLL